MQAQNRAGSQLILHEIKRKLAKIGLNKNETKNEHTKSEKNRYGSKVFSRSPEIPLGGQAYKTADKYNK